jgi:hypothetical protein
MAKSYTEQLTEWVRQRGQTARPDRNRVAFLAVKNDVREALEEGWPVKTIWSHMVEQKRIGFGYDTFLVYVKRHVNDAIKPSGVSGSRRHSVRPLSPEARPSRQRKAEASPCRPDQMPHEPEQMSGFTFNAAPNREELI